MDIPIFIASSLSDFQSERDCLVKKVFPIVNAQVRAHGVRLVPIDFRWGLKQKEFSSLAKTTLLAIEHCRRATTELPWVITLRGQHFGSLTPLPDVKEYPTVVKDHLGWLEDVKLAHPEGVSMPTVMAYHTFLGASDTVRQHASKQRNPHSFFLLRKADFMQTVPCDAKADFSFEYLPLNKKEQMPESSRGRYKFTDKYQQLLAQRLKIDDAIMQSRLPKSHFEYSCRYDKPGYVTDLHEFASYMISSLTSSLKAEFPVVTKAVSIDPHVRMIRSVKMVGRKPILQALDDYVARDEPGKVLALTATGVGQGVRTILAQFSKNLRTKCRPIIILLGPPGSGKGTQAVKMAQRHNLRHLSTGDLLRAAVKDGTEEGLAAQESMNKGQLVADHVILELIKAAIGDQNEKPAGFILDGFPRTLQQAEMLDEMLKDTGESVDLVLSLEVDDAVLVERVCGRWTHKPSGRSYHVKFNPPAQPFKDDVTGDPLTQRDDDNEETLKHRLETYWTKTVPLLEHYQAKILKVDGGKSPKAVAEQCWTLSKDIVSSGVVDHFVGVDVTSGDIRETLSRLCHLLKRHLPEEEQVGLVVPTFFQDLRDEWHDFYLRKVSLHKKVVVIFSGIESFYNTYGVQEMLWLPKEPLPNTSIILGITLSGKSSAALWTCLQDRCTSLQQVCVGDMSRPEGREMFTTVMDTYHKTLSEEQMELVLSKPEAKSPLYLRTVADVLLRFGVYEQVTAFIKTIPGDVDGLFDFCIQVLGKEHGHEADWAWTMSLLACSRGGLAQFQLEHMIEAKKGVKDTDGQRRTAGNSVNDVLAELLGSPVKNFLSIGDGYIYFKEERFCTNVKEQNKLEDPAVSAQYFDVLADYFSKVIRRNLEDDSFTPKDLAKAYSDVIPTLLNAKRPRQVEKLVLHVQWVMKALDICSPFSVYHKFALYLEQADAPRVGFIMAQVVQSILHEHHHDKRRTRLVNELLPKLRDLWLNTSEPPSTVDRLNIMRALLSLTAFEHAEALGTSGIMPAILGWLKAQGGLDPETPSRDSMRRLQDLVMSFLQFFRLEETLRRSLLTAGAVVTLVALQANHKEIGAALQRATEFRWAEYQSQDAEHQKALDRHLAYLHHCERFQDMGRQLLRALGHVFAEDLLDRNTRGQDEEAEAEVSPAQSVQGVGAATHKGGQQIMISYCWDEQPTIMKLSKYLQAKGFQIWLDVERMAGSTLSAMADAVDGSQIILMCMSNGYQNSVNCNLEAEYAMQKRKKIIPLMMEDNFSAHGLLGIILGAKLWHNFKPKALKTDAQFQSACAAVTKELVGAGIDATASEASVAVTEGTGPAKANPENQPFNQWTVHRVGSWLSRVGLPQLVAVFHKAGMDGAALLHLTWLSAHSEQPQYYSTLLGLLAELGVSSVGDRLCFLGHLQMLQEQQ